jgi:hypothetical protein
MTGMLVNSGSKNIAEYMKAICWYSSRENEKKN